MTEKEEIVDAIVRGYNSKVLGVLYKKALPNIKKYILKNNGKMEDVQDIFQDAVTILYKKIKMDNAVPEGDIFNYLFVMAKNLWINKAKRDTKVTYSDEQFEITDSDKNFVDFIVDKERKQLVEQLLKELGEPCATMVKLMYYKGFSMKEIVEEMGISSVGVAKQNSFRCKKKLLKLIESNPEYLRKVRELNEK